MDRNCLGCGIKLQDENVLLDGYTTSLDNELCQRCFRLKNYGEYREVNKNNDDYLEILEDINKKKSLVLYIIDLLNIDKNVEKIRKIISNPMIIVLNKRDVLPKSIIDDKLVEYIKNTFVNVLDVVLISAEKNYNIDLLFKKIKKYQKDNKVYVVGHTNVGKSSLINKLIKNYSQEEKELTISSLPSTTLDTVEIKLKNNLKMIDTPGLVDRGSIVNYIDIKMLKRISPKKEIKPRTYQLKKNQGIVIEDFLRFDYTEGDKNSITLFVANNVKVKRINSIKNNILKDLNKREVNVKMYEDVVVNGLGFFRVIDKCKLDMYINKDIDVFTRKTLI